MRSSINAITVAVAKITGERRWRVGKKCFCVVVLLTRRSRVRGKEKKKRFGAFYSTSNKLLLVARHILCASKNAFKVGSVKFANSLSPLSIVKKVRTGSKSSQGT